MAKIKRVLFVCLANMYRSPLAEALYKNDPRYEVRSAGVASYARRLLTKQDLEWADIVFVMDEEISEIIKISYNADTSSFIVLNIADVYNTNDPAQRKELAKILLEKLRPYLGKPRS